MAPLIVGVVLAFAVGLLGTVVGFDRDRSFYATVLIVIGFLYALFAAMGASGHTLLLESLAGVGFLLAAVIGFRSSLWIVVAGLAGHGVFDIVHGGIIDNPGVPTFWPAFCGAYDIVAAAYLAWVIKSKRLSAAAPVPTARA